VNGNGPVVLALVAFAGRHDHHPVKHLLIPGLGAFMNIAELLGVLYIAFTGSGTSPGDATKAIGIVVIWCLVGFIWVMLNPNRHPARGVHQERLASPERVPTA
jgi:heme/copper-type cytochrome/quinol oxidase subunit 4